jgi:DNA-binding transcriptional ArsR family regulator
LPEASTSRAIDLVEQHRARWLIAVADPVRLQILRALSLVSDATASELAVRSQTSQQTLRRHLEAMEVSGVIRVHPGKSDGETPGRPAARFSLSPDVRESVCLTLRGSRNEPTIVTSLYMDS